MKLTDKVSTFPAIGPKYEQILQKLHISTIGDLLYHLPYRYTDTSEIGRLADLNRDHKLTVRATIQQIKSIRLRRGKSLQKAIVTDGDDAVEVVWFNQRFLTSTLKADMEVLLFGKLNPKSIKPQLSAPEYQIIDDKNIHLGRIVPVYSLISGLSLKWLRSRLFQLIENLDHIDDLQDHLEPEIKSKYNLSDLAAALRCVHFPENFQDMQAGTRRLAFDELIDLHLKLIKRKNTYNTLKPFAIKSYGKQINKFIKSLPFELTASQLQTIEEIYQDYNSGKVMHRLLQGDVGSGKTIVAALAAIPIINSGFKVVILAPTTVLAKQHYESFENYFSNHSCALVTSETKTKGENLVNIDILIGTHALLHRAKALTDNIGLLVVDEQHRFGVNQRREILNLKANSFSPHLLQMTATPIPRSLALSLFGDLEVSSIEKPPGRQETKTLLVPADKRISSINWIKEQLLAGEQIFWICPLIEDSLELEAKSVLAIFPEIKSRFSDFKVRFLHGKLANAEKLAVLSDFAKGKIDILVSTTVIEVGINIPNANIIIIEDAERYGLAQLHQLRGRVGRANRQGWCLLYSSKTNDHNILTRLQFFTKETNGIKIAEFDLNKRGPGEVYGTKQSGLPQLKVANFTNLEMLKQSREAALQIYNKNITNA